MSHLALAGRMGDVTPIGPDPADVGAFAARLWIDAVTLLPVKTRFLPARGQTVESTGTVQWLPRTSANLAHLQQVAPPAGFTVLNAAPSNLVPVPGAS